MTTFEPGDLIELASNTRHYLVKRVWNPRFKRFTYKPSGTVSPGDKLVILFEEFPFFFVLGQKDSGFFGSLGMSVAFKKLNVDEET